MLFQKEKPLLGLDIGSSSIKLIQLSEARGRLKLERFGIMHLPPELIVDGTVMDSGSVVETIKELFEEQKTKIKEVALSVSGHSVIVKKIMLPPMSEEELEESIKWEAEQYIPFDINDVNMDFHILETTEGPDGKGQMSVLLVAVKKDKLAEYTSLVNEAGLVPVVLDVDAFALENMFCLNYDFQPEEVVALVNIGASVMNINILKNGQFTFTRDISVGGNRYTEAIQKELNLSYEQADEAKRGGAIPGVEKDAVETILHVVHSEAASEISRSFEYFKTTSANENIDKIILSGGAAKIRGFGGFLTEKLSVPVEIANPFRNIEVDHKRFDPGFLEEAGPLAAIGVGLALRRKGDR
ncbi:MAG TPA: type IV pilus assembly protein PilM [Nitrospiria bacterium]